MHIQLRSYQDSDYEHLKRLYEDSSLYGGQFDEARDGRVRLRNIIERDPEAIWIALINDIIVGTISIIDDGRVGMLFRFAVQRGSMEQEVAKCLHKKSADVLRERGHEQVLVYTPVGEEHLYERYDDLGMNKGNNYTCYWEEL